MPNIEIHGVDSEEALAVREKIFHLTRELSFKDEIVVTIYPTTCYDPSGTSQSFLRILSDNEHQFLFLIRSLRVLGMDIELLRLKEFLSLGDQYKR